MKACRDCKLEKPPEDYGKDSSRKDGQRVRCKACTSLRTRENYAANPEIHKARVRSWELRNRERHLRAAKNQKLKSAFGITLEQKEKMVADQGGECKICREVMKNPYVDHCHTTGKIRGLLCRDCNFAIGLLGDSVENCISAAAYLTPIT